MSVKIGLYGNVASYWEKVEAKVGTAFLLNAELEGPKSAFTGTFPLAAPVINPGVWAGSVFFNTETNIILDLELSATAPMQDAFAGFMGLCGGELVVGADYGEYFVPMIPLFHIFNPYARGDGMAQTAYYMGPKTGDKFPDGANFEFSAHPIMTFGSKWDHPVSTTHGNIWGRLDPLATLTVGSGHADISSEYSLELYASAELKVEDFIVGSEEKEFSPWTILPRTTYTSNVRLY